MIPVPRNTFSFAPAAEIRDTDIAGHVPVFTNVKTLFALTKPRLAFFSILSAMAGYAGTQGGNTIQHTLISLAGISLAAGGALSLNQWWERVVDAGMSRTRNRPLPSNQISSSAALIWSSLLCISGPVLLASAINWLSALLAALTIILYGFVYTPLKRRTRWATEIGSISGSLPPLLGAAAANEITSIPAWVLAGILIFWQMPHFYGIGWMYRKDYQSAGFPLLPATDKTGKQTARWTLVYTLCLGIISLLPWWLGWLGLIYGATALTGFGYMLWRAYGFMIYSNNRNAAARKLFFATVIYLPPVMAALVIDRYLS